MFGWLGWVGVISVAPGPAGLDLSTETASAAVAGPAGSLQNGVLVHLEPEGTYLERAGANGEPQRVEVCQAPCDLRVARGSGYRVGNASLEYTPRFALREDALIEAQLASRDRDFVGGWLTIGGGGLLLIGSVFLVVAATSHRPEPRDNFLIIGGVAGGVGLSLGTLGLLLFLNNDSQVTLNGQPVPTE